ncbi:hypothetical protein ACVWZW_002885 [Bradyrhizobium sp. F1.13.4]
MPAESASVTVISMDIIASGMVSTSRSAIKAATGVP